MNQKSDLLWLEIRQFYKREFNISPKLLDILSIYDIMVLCCEGRSNKHIARVLEITDESFIRSALDLAFDFYGWDEDLDCNPREIFIRNRNNKYAFISSVTTLSVLTTRSNAIISWEINEKLDRYSKLLDEQEKGIKIGTPKV